MNLFPRSDVRNERLWKVNWWCDKRYFILKQLVNFILSCKESSRVDFCQLLAAFKTFRFVQKLFKLRLSYCKKPLEDFLCCWTLTRMLWTDWCRGECFDKISSDNKDYLLPQFAYKYNLVSWLYLAGAGLLGGDICLLLRLCVSLSHLRKNCNCSHFNNKYRDIYH